MENKEAVVRIRQHMERHKIGQYPHIHIGEALEKAIDALEKMDDLVQKAVQAEYTRRMNERLIEVIRSGVVDIDKLCKLCKYEKQCDQECLLEEGQDQTRFWNCMYGQQWEPKEEPNERTN